MPGVGAVLDRVLADADARQPDLVERGVIRAAAARLRVDTAPITPLPANGTSSGRSTSAADGGPNTVMPRALPVPESMLK